MADLKYGTCGCPHHCLCVEFEGKLYPSAAAALDAVVEERDAAIERAGEAEYELEYVRLFLC